MAKSDDYYRSPEYAEARLKEWVTRHLKPEDDLRFVLVLIEKIANKH